MQFHNLTFGRQLFRQENNFVIEILSQYKFLNKQISSWENVEFNFRHPNILVFNIIVAQMFKTGINCKLS